MLRTRRCIALPPRIGCTDAAIPTIFTNLLDTTSAFQASIAMTGKSEARAALAAQGTLRATINVGNPILAGVDKVTGAPYGVSVDIARELASRLDTPLELIVVEAAKQSVETVAGGQADVGFFAVDPVRGAAIAFTEPYVLIEGCYLVRQDSPIRNNSQVDAADVRVAAGAGSAYDLNLTRELKHATIVRVPTSPAVVDAFVAQRLEVAAGVKQQLQADAARHQGLRLIDEPFMVIRQAMGVARARGEAAAQYLRAFIDDLRGSAFVREALARHGIKGATPG